MRHLLTPFAVLAGTMCCHVQVQARTQELAQVPAGAADFKSTIPAARDDDLLLYEIQLGGQVLSEAIIAHGDIDDPLLPVGELSRMLGLDITIQPDRGLITGRLGEALRALTLDISSGEGRSGSKGVAIRAGDVQVSYTEIFVRSSILAELLPLKFKVDPDSLSIGLTPTEKLPIEARQERSERLMRLGQTMDGSAEVMRVDAPYRWSSMPAFDFTADLGYDSVRNDAVRRFEARAAADVLQTGVTAYFATDNRANPFSARVKAERKSLSGSLFGPLNATYAAAGDVYSPSLALGPRSMSGAGFVISTADQEEASVFERINLRGELPVGYDVELYVNDILRAGQNTAAEGRYEFLDVPLVRGVNVIRIVVYGPRGERNEATRVINVGGGQVEQGKTVIDAGIVWQERPLIEFDNASQVSSGVARGQPRAVVSVAHGLTPTLTARAGGAIWTDQAGELRRVVVGGIRTSLGGFAMQVDHAQDLGHGSATSAGLAGQVAGVSVVSRHIEYADVFADENVASFDPNRPMRRYSELTFDMTVPFLVQTRLPISGRIERNQFADGGVSWIARGRTAVSVADTLVSMGVDYASHREKGSSIQQLSGSIAATRLINYNWQVRAAADFDFKPASRLRSLTLSADRSLSDRHRLRFGLAKSFGEFEDLTAQMGLSARFPFAEATLSGDYSTVQKNWRVGMQLSFGFAFDPTRRSYRMTPPGPGAGASAAFHAFRDLNANGRPDPGEEGVEGIVLHGGGANVETGPDGTAFLTGLGDGPSGMLRADMNNVDTVFDATPPANISFATRAGDVVKILYPIVPTSEVIATMKTRLPGGRLTGLSSVRLKLIPEQGKTLELSTEFDGAVVFEQVRPGRYEITLDPAQASQLGMSLAHPVHVEVGMSGRVIRLDGQITFQRRELLDPTQFASGNAGAEQRGMQ